TTVHSRTTSLFLLFSFKAPPTSEIYTLSLHDALPISNRAARSRTVTERSRRGELTTLSERGSRGRLLGSTGELPRHCPSALHLEDRKSTRLNSSHDQISYAVFCLKKKIQHLHTSCPS